jgi:hypothetical protein
MISRIFNVMSITLIAILLGCSSDNTIDENQNINSEVEQPESIFLSNSEVQGLINSHSTFFMGYWSGMTKDQVNEVTRYLLSKEEIMGIVYDPDDDSSSLNICRDFSLDFDGKCKYREFNKDNFYLLKSDKSKKFTVLIGRTRFDVEFKYAFLNNQNLLSGIVLSVVSEHTTSSYIDYENFNQVAELYQEKYSTPSKKYFDSPNSGYLKFNVGNIQIDVDYSSSESIPTFGKGYAPNQMRIEYKDLELTGRVKSNFETQKKLQENENQRIRDSLKNANKNNSLRRI